MARTKGSGGTKTLTSISLGELRENCSDDTIVVVQTKWLKSHGLFGEEQQETPAQAQPVQIPVSMEEEEEQGVDIQVVDLKNL